MKKFILISLLLPFLFIACNKDKYFKLNRPEIAPIQNVNDLEYYVTSPYNALFQFPGWQSPIGMISYYGELVGDIAFANPFSIEQEAIKWYPRQISTFDVTGNQMEGTFQCLYLAINNVNIPLAVIEEKEAANLPVFTIMETGDDAKLKRQKGELYFMRAFSYWMLSRAFMPPYNDANNNKKFIPLITKVIPTQAGMRNPELGTVKEVYDQMVSDLVKAKDLLPESNKRGRATKYAASAMLMRIYWLMGKNTETLAECNYIIGDAESKNVYNLTEDPIRAFNRNTESLYTNNPVAKEVIWDVPFTVEGFNQPIPLARMSKIGAYNYNSKAGSYSPADGNWVNGLRIAGGYDNWNHGGWACAYWNPNTINYIGWATTANPQDKVDYVPSAEALKDKRFTQLHWFLKGNVGTDLTLYAKDKYEQQFPKVNWNIFWNDKYFRAPYARYTNVPIIRLPEIYLTRASLDPSKALSDVNKVRARAGLDPLTSVTESDVEKERIKELGFEGGDRLNYLISMKRSIDGNKISLDAIDPQSSTNNPMVGTKIPAIDPPYSNMYVPLPAVEYLYSGTASQSGK